MKERKKKKIKAAGATKNCFKKCFTFLQGQRKKIWRPGERRGGGHRSGRCGGRRRKQRHRSELEGVGGAGGVEIYVAVKWCYSLLYGALPVSWPRTHLTGLTFTLWHRNRPVSPPPPLIRPHLPHKRSRRLSPFFLNRPLFIFPPRPPARPPLLPLGRTVKYIIDFLELRTPDWESAGCKDLDQSLTFNLTPPIKLSGDPLTPHSAQRSIPQAAADILFFFLTNTQSLNKV